MLLSVKLLRNFQISARAKQSVQEKKKNQPKNKSKFCNNNKKIPYNGKYRLIASMDKVDSSAHDDKWLGKKKSQFSLEAQVF